MQNEAPKKQKKTQIGRMAAWSHVFKLEAEIHISRVVSYIYRLKTQAKAKIPN